METVYNTQSPTWIMETVYNTQSPSASLKLFREGFKEYKTSARIKRFGT